MFRDVSSDNFIDLFDVGIISFNRFDTDRIESISEIANNMLFESNQSGYVTPPISGTQPTEKLTPARITFLTRPLQIPSPAESYTGEPWYQEVEACLQGILRIDRENGDYSQGECENIKGAIRALQECINSHNIKEPKPLLNLMKLLSEHLFCGVETFFYEALNLVRSQWEALNVYMRDVQGQENEGPVLKPAGVQKIVDFFIKEYSFPKEMLSRRYLSNLPGLVRRLIASNEEGKAVGWVVCSDNPEEKHVVPVFAVYRYGQAHVFVIDSEGHNVYPDHPEYKGYTRLHSSIQILRKGCNWNEKVQFYSYKMRRQTDNVSCTVFSLLDLKSLIELHLDGLNLVEFYKKQEGPKAPKLILPEEVDEDNQHGLPFYELSILPPSMLKATQSYTRLKELKEQEYLVDLSYQSHRYSSTGQIIVKTQNIDNLFEEIDAYKFYNSEGESRNLYTLSKRFSYIIYLIVSVLEARKEPKVFTEVDENLPKTVEPTRESSRGLTIVSDPILLILDRLRSSIPGALARSKTKSSGCLCIRNQRCISLHMEESIPLCF